MNRDVIVILLMSLASFYLSSCSSQKNLKLTGFSKGQVKYEDGSRNVDSSKLLKRSNQNIVQISFFEIFDDSVVVYIGNRVVWKGGIYKINNPFSSTGWSGTDLNINLKSSTNTITIKLVKQKEYIQFNIYKEFPSYMIQRYNNTWYIRSLMNYINLK